MTTENETQTITKKRRFSWKGTGILFSAFAFIVILCVMYYTYYRFIEMHRLQLSENAAMVEKMEVLKNELGEVIKARTHQDEEIQKLNASVQQFEKTQSLDTTFAIANADFLVKLASENLQFENNIPITIELLKKADEAIKNLTAPKVFAAREALAKDIATLQGVPIVDVTGIYMRLNALNNELQKMPLLNQITSSKEQTQNVVPNSDESWWRRGLAHTWQSLTSLVVVRYNDSSRSPLISPGSETYLFENLHAFIMHAMWALLHGNVEVYKASLATTKQYVQEYFVADSSVTSSVLKELNTLYEIDIHPVAPEITDSLQALSALKKGE
jgi:uroporphyrin-3 C-methyltransferase